MEYIYQHLDKVVNSAKGEQHACKKYRQRELSWHQEQATSWMFLGYFLLLFIIYQYYCCHLQGSAALVVSAQR